MDLLSIIPSAQNPEEGPISTKSIVSEVVAQQNAIAQARANRAALAKQKRRAKNMAIYGTEDKREFNKETIAEHKENSAKVIRNSNKPVAYAPQVLSPVASNHVDYVPVGTTPHAVNKLLASLNINLNVQLTKTDTHNLLATILTCNETQLNALYNNKKVPLAIKTVIKRIIDDSAVGDIRVIERLWNRIFGDNMLKVDMPEGYTGIVPNVPVSREAYIVIRETLYGHE